MRGDAEGPATRGLSPAHPAGRGGGIGTEDEASPSSDEAEGRRILLAWPCANDVMGRPFNPNSFCGNTGHYLRA
jgi:hypothetical protein